MSTANAELDRPSRVACELLGANVSLICLLLICDIMQLQAAKS
jgi:hypothetical protein